MKRELLRLAAVLAIVLALLLVFGWVETRIGYEAFGWLAVMVSSLGAAVCVVLTVVAVAKRPRKRDKEIS